MKSPIIILCLVLLCTLASCGSSGIESDIAADAHGSSGVWDPFAAAQSITPLEGALATAGSVSIGGRELIALDSQNRPAPQALANLRWQQGAGNSLSLSLSKPQAALSFYIRLGGEQLISAEFAESVVGLSAEAQSGYHAIGMVAPGRGKLLPAGSELVQLSFAAGPASPLRRPSISQDDRSAARNLSAVDNGNEGATLQWSERNTGDYDLNGEVNISDLTPIGANFFQSYTEESENFARLEVVDGDENGEINIADLTPIGQNFGSFIRGYNIYRTELTSPDEVPDPADSGRWTKVLNGEGLSDPTIARQFNGQDFRLVYTFQDESGQGDFGWYVAGVGRATDSPLEGPQSNVTTVTVDPIGPPPAGLAFEIQAPATENLAVNDEFYLGIRVINVTGLFSANVRFEYDSSVVELVESVPNYTDHDNFLVPPLFLAVDDVDAATSPYVLLGFNATQTQGEAVKDGSGVIGYFRFRATAPGNVTEAFRFPQSSNFILLWGEQYGVPIANPALGAPQSLLITP